MKISELYSLWDEGKKITAIKELRAVLGTDLKETLRAFKERDIAALIEKKKKYLEEMIQNAKDLLHQLEELNG